MRSILFLIFALRFSILLQADVTYSESDSIPFSRPSNETEYQIQKAFFQKNGYLWIKNFFSKDQVIKLQNWAETFNIEAQKTLKLMQNSEEIPSNFLIVVPEANAPFQVCRVEDMLSCYPDLQCFIENTLSSFIGTLLNKPYIPFKDKLNFKWPGGGAFLPHQDFPAFELLAPREHITAMICIDPATLENGCLQVAKNWRETFANNPEIDSELLELGLAVIPYVKGGIDHGSIQSKYVEKISWLPIEASPGDLVLINSYVPHYSKPNESKTPRQAMFFTYNKLEDGEYKTAYYKAKREDPDNPRFHFGTPTKARDK